MLFILIIFGFSLINCKSSSNHKNSLYTSIISIIANPKDFHKKTIIVQGYFTMETEGQAIYLSKNDFEKNIFKNALYLYIPYGKIKEIVIKNLIDYFMWTFKKGIIDFDKITFENFGVECCRFCETKNNSSSIFDTKHREIKVLFISSRSLICQDKNFIIAKVQTHNQILNIGIHEEDRDYYEKNKIYSCVIVRDNKGKLRYELGLEITD